MNKQLNQLYHSLVHHGFVVEAQAIVNLGQQTQDLENWKAVLTELNEPIPDQVSTSIQYLKDGMSDMIQNAKELQNLSPEDLKALVDLASHTNPNQLNKSSQAELLKGLWGGTKFLGKRTLQLMPLVGFIFGFLFALKNFVYGLASFAKLVKDSEQIGLNWLEILLPSKLEEKITTYQDDPIHLKTLVRLTKYSQAFADEGISFVSNGIDFVKDIIFLFLDIGSFGWLTIGDVGISIVLMVLQYLAQSNASQQYDEVLNKIKALTETKIKELSSTDFSTMDPDDLKQWFLSH